MANLVDLPAEILIEIFKYINTSDLMHLVQVFPQLDYFLNEKGVMNKISFDKCFETHVIDLYHYLTQSMNADFVTTLNLNCIYWINGLDLYKILKKCPNIKNLYVIDTDFCSSKSCSHYLNDSVYLQNNLHSLAMNVYNDNREFWETITLRSLKRALIKNYVDSTYAVNLSRTIKSWHGLEEVWFIDLERFSNCYYAFHLLPSLKKVVFMSKFFIKEAYDFREVAIKYALVYSNQQSGLFESVFVKKDMLRKNYNAELPKPGYWHVFDDLHFGFPCGYKDSLALACQNDVNFMTFQYREINLNNKTSNIYNPRLNAAFKDLLLSNNCRHLKGLCITTAIFLESKESNEERTSSSSNGFKSKRVGVQANPSHHFLKIAQNMPDLEELEVFNSEFLVSFKLSDIMSGFSFIHHFHNLKKLTLEFPCGLDGSFLKDVFKNCPLRSLRITCQTYNDKLSFALCNNIQSCTDLRDLRLDLNNLDVDTFLDSLTQLKNLQRLLLDIDDVDKFSVNPLEKFLTNNIYLIFFYIAIRKYPQSAMKNVSKTLRQFRSCNNAKIFIAQKSDNSFTGCFPIPYAHQDMTEFYSKVGSISYDDFCTM